MARAKRSQVKKKKVVKQKRTVLDRSNAEKKSQEDKKESMVKLRNATHRRVKIMAAYEGKQMSDLVDELLTTTRKLR